MNKSRRIKVDINRGEGTLTYDISHINSEWEKLVQVYELPESMYETQELVTVSAFRVYKKNSIISESLNNYPRTHKDQLWQELFELKRFYLQMVRPDAVKHLIESNFMEARFKRYEESLQSPDYIVFRDDHYIWFYLK